MKNKSLIKKEDLMKTVFKGRVIGKNYDRVMEDVSNTLKNVIFKLYFFVGFKLIKTLFQIFGFSISNIKEDAKQFILVNNMEKMYIPGITYSSSTSSNYRILLKPIIVILTMLHAPISEGFII